MSDVETVKNLELKLDGVTVIIGDADKVRLVAQALTKKKPARSVELVDVE